MIGDSIAQGNRWSGGGGGGHTFGHWGSRWVFIFVPQDTIQSTICHWRSSWLFSGLKPLNLSHWDWPTTYEPLAHNFFSTGTVRMTQPMEGVTGQCPEILRGQEALPGHSGTPGNRGFGLQNMIMLQGRQIIHILKLKSKWEWCSVYIVDNF